MLTIISCVALIIAGLRSLPIGTIPYAAKHRGRAAGSGVRRSLNDRSLDVCHAGHFHHRWIKSSTSKLHLSQMLLVTPARGVWTSLLRVHIDPNVIRRIMPCHMASTPLYSRRVAILSTPLVMPIASPDLCRSFSIRLHCSIRERSLMMWPHC